MKLKFKFLSKHEMRSLCKSKLLFALMPPFLAFKIAQICAVLLILKRDQCDQMARLFLQYLPTYNSENLPKSISKLPKKVETFAIY